MCCSPLKIATVVNEKKSHEHAQYQQNANVAIFSAEVKHWCRSTKKHIAKRKNPARRAFSKITIWTCDLFFFF